MGLKAWDCAAGDLIVREAGGLVCDFDAGNGYLRSGNIIAAPARVLKEMLNKIILNTSKSLSKLGSEINL